MIEENAKRAIALGFFDGVHLGHKKLMDTAVQRAKENGAISSVFTFDVHPDTLITGNPVPLITSNAGRNDEIRRIGGVDEVIFSHFDNQMMKMGWIEFIHEVLVKRFHACYLISGRNNRFGYRGLGTPEGLAKECHNLGIGYDCIESVEIDGIVVSSTYIRTLIAAGDMERAQKYLGHPYTISGVVGRGRQVGRTYGVPTVNLSLPMEMQAPPFGVYVARAVVGNKSYLAATNIGIKPTFTDGGAPTIEPHILDFSGDLYGKFIRIELYKYLRPERQFASVEELKTEIERNIQQTRDFFSANEKEGTTSCNRF